MIQDLFYFPVIIIVPLNLTFFHHCMEKKEDLFYFKNNGPQTWGCVRRGQLSLKAYCTCISSISKFTVYFLPYTSIVYMLTKMGGGLHVSSLFYIVNLKKNVCCGKKWGGDPTPAICQRHYNLLELVEGCAWQKSKAWFVILIIQYKKKNNV